MFTCPATATAMLIAFQQVASVEVVTIGTEGASYPPYVIVAPNGEVTGFEKELADEVCVRAELDCTWKFAQFDELLPGVMSGRFDIALGGIAVTDERKADVDFSLSYGDPSDTIYFLGRPDARGFDRALIGVQAGTIFESFVASNQLSYQSYPTIDELIEAAIAGEVELLLSSMPHEQRLALTGSHGFIEKGSATIPDQGTAMAVCKGNDELKGRIDTALKAMMLDGTLETISERWFP